MAAYSPGVNTGRLQAIADALYPSGVGPPQVLAYLGSQPTTGSAPIGSTLLWQGSLGGYTIQGGSPTQPGVLTFLLSNASPVAVGTGIPSWYRFSDGNATFVMDMNATEGVALNNGPIVTGRPVVLQNLSIVVPVQQFAQNVGVSIVSVDNQDTMVSGFSVPSPPVQINSIIIEHADSVSCSVQVTGPGQIDNVFVEDAIPPGGVANAVSGSNEAWSFINSNPTPFSGTLAHQSPVASGTHQHYFTQATAPMVVASGDSLFAMVWLDPANPPTEIMLQWHVAPSDFEHRAYWGANSITFGTNGTDSRRFMGALPPTGQWVRLQVLATQVGLNGKNVDGVAFTAFGGRVVWDYAGRFGQPTPPIIWGSANSINVVQSGAGYNLNNNCTSTLGYTLSYQLLSGVLAQGLHLSSPTVSADSTATVGPSGGSGGAYQFLADDGHGNQAASPPNITINVQPSTVVLASNNFALQGFVLLPVDTDGQTQIKFGGNVASCYVPDRSNSNLIYFLGGQVFQANTPLDAGNQRLFSVDLATGNVVTEYPYHGASSEVQPAHPTHVGLAYSNVNNVVIATPGKGG